MLTSRTGVKRTPHRFGYRTENHVEVGFFFQTFRTTRRKRYALGQFGGERFRAFYGDGNQQSKIVTRNDTIGIRGRHSSNRRANLGAAMRKEVEKKERESRLTW